MTKENAKRELYNIEKKLAAYNHALGLIYYDAVTGAPSGSSANRAETLTVLGEEVYKLTAGEQITEILNTLDGADVDSNTKRIVEIKLKDARETARIPMDEYLEYERLITSSSAVWHEAKLKSDYAMFKPYIKQITDTLKRFAGYVAPAVKPYDYLLDKYEPGLTSARLDDFFDLLAKGIAPLIDKAKQQKVKPLPKGVYPIDKQKELSAYLMKLIGMDERYSAIAETEHPFTTGFTKWDVRIATHYVEDDLLSNMYSVIHEGGHALYDMHTADELQYTVLGAGTSMAVHESQSRFYENIIGRSRSFITFIAPTLKRLFPALAELTDNDLYIAANAAKPSLVRTDADELTYSLHIIIRYRLEKMLFEDQIDVDDLESEWNRLYGEYLGIVPANAREGILQDCHWSDGSFGYFPSYALGSAYGAQLLKQMKKSVDVEGDVQKGEFNNINNWLNENIWRFGSLKKPNELMENAFDGLFDPNCYIKYLNDKFGELLK